MSLKQKNMFLSSYVFKTCPYVLMSSKHVLVFLCLQNMSSFQHSDLVI